MKKAALTALQVAVTLGILYFVFHDPAKRAEMGTALASSNWHWLLAGFGVYGVVEFLAGLRWQALLQVQGITLGWMRIFALVMIGLFFNFLIPGGTGGDVVKIFYLMKETPGQRATALLSVLVDRLIGLVSLILLAVVFIAANWQWVLSTPETAQYVWMVFIILGVSSVGLLFSFVICGFKMVHRLPAKMPGRERLAELALGYSLYARAWRRSLLALGYSVVVHLGYFLTFYCAARAFASPEVRIPTLSQFFAVSPIVNTIISMPISIGGVGVREGLFEVFLGKLCGVRPAIAVIIASTGYAVTLCWGVIGAVIYLFYRPSEHARLRDMRQQIGAMKHVIAEVELEREVSAGGTRPR